MKDRKLLRWILAIGVISFSIGAFLLAILYIGTETDNDSLQSWALITYAIGCILMLATSVTILMAKNVWYSIDERIRLKDELLGFKKKYHGAKEAYDKAKNQLHDITIQLQKDLREVIERINEEYPNKEVKDEQTKD